MADIKPDKTADLKGLNCPMPVLKAKKAIESIEPGQVLEVIVTDQGAKSDIPAMLRRTGHELLGVTEEGKIIKFLIKKK